MTALLVAGALVVVADEAKLSPPALTGPAQFGVWDADTNGVPVLLRTKVVPLDLGVAYGWRMPWAESNRTVRVKQVLTLPGKPMTWGKKNNVKVTGNQQSATWEEQQAPKDGWLVGVIRVADGDPEGTHKLKIFVEGRSVTNFEFETKLDAPWPGE